MKDDLIDGAKRIGAGLAWLALVVAFCAATALAQSTPPTKADLAARADKLAADAAALGVEIRKLPDPTPQPTPDPPSPGAGFDRAVFRPDRLEYLGSARLPAFVGNRSTAYSPGPLTHRYVGGKLRFLSTVHWGPALGNSGVYEFELPPRLGTTIPSTADCFVVRDYGDAIYGGLKTLGDKPAIVHGLCWVDDPTTGEQSLYWTFGAEYTDAATVLLDSVGVTSLESGEPRFTGVWRADCSSQFTRGGIARIPEWFAPHVGGRAYVLGFGGYFSVHEGGWGPALLACDNPVWPEATVPANLSLRAPAVGFLPLVQYPPKLRAPRSPDFHSPPGDETGAGGSDRWSWADLLGGDTGAGSFVWFDLPDCRGAVFFPSMGTGLCQYDQQTRWITSEGRKIACYVYDEKDLARAAKGELKSSDVPVWFADFPTPLAGTNKAPMLGGFTLDATTRTLYAVERFAINGRDIGQVEPRAVIHAWRVR